MTEDADFIAAVILLAEMKMCFELPGDYNDDEMDDLIRAARRLRDREGFFVEHSPVRPIYGRHHS